MATRKRKAVVGAALAIAGVMLVTGALAYGFLCNERKLPGYGLIRGAYDWARGSALLRHVHSDMAGSAKDREAGRWEWARGMVADEGLTDVQKDAFAKLHAIGYLPGYEPAGTLEGVTVNVPDAAWPGLNLYTSGHGQEAILMDMDGREVHSWSYDFGDAFPDHPAAASQWFGETWVRVYPYDNGDLLAIYERLGMIKLDRDSNLIWANPRGFHHDLFVDDDGLIYALSEEVRIIPRINEQEPVVEDFITVVNPDGTVVRNVSLLEAFENSSYASFLDKMPASGDLMHTNTVEVFDGSQAGRSPIFKKGNVLTSSRELNVIAIVDMETEQVVWALAGQWQAQHNPTLLANGNILLLDNRGHRGMSKDIEIDPFTQEIAWAYEGTPENGFYTYGVGANQRLPNGNTLVTESTAGRAFEVTPDGSIVWEFYNPARAGDDGELIATIFELQRLEPGRFSWLR